MASLAQQIGGLRCPSLSHTHLSRTPFFNQTQTLKRIFTTNAAGARRASVVWFRNDLRVHDNECLSSANNESMAVLPVYCFDPRDYGKSSSGFDKTGSYRASFLSDGVEGDDVAVDNGK